MWSTIQIILGVTALLLAFAGSKLSMPLLGDAAIVCFGLTSAAIGWEGIITQHMVIGSRRRGSRRTYTGIPAILQGIQFNLIGFFLIVVAIMMHFNINGRAIVLQFVRRPGLPLIVFGGLLLLQAVITLIGSLEDKEGQRWLVTLNLLVSRLLPGGILVLLGLGAIGLGLFEIAAPATFDAMGGGFLEAIYGLH